MDLDVSKDAKRTKQIDNDNAVVEFMSKALRGRKALYDFATAGRWMSLSPFVTKTGSRAKTTSGAIDAVTGFANGGTTATGRLHEITIAVMLKAALGPRYAVHIVRRAYDIVVVAPTGLTSKIEVKSAQMDAESKSTAVRFRQEQLALGTRIVMALYDAHNPARMHYVITDAATIRACLDATDTPITPETQLVIKNADSPVWSILKDDTYSSPSKAIARLKKLF